MPASPTYPGDRNNDPNSNEFPTRDLALINQPAGSIEFVNTRSDEVLHISYKDGSFIKFNKFSTDHLNINDERTHTQGDSFETTNGNKVQVVDKDQDTVIYGNQYTKVGDVDKHQKYHELYKKILRPLHNLKRLFEIRRTKNHNPIDQAPDQVKTGSFAANPSDDIKVLTLVTATPSKYTVGSKEAGNHSVYELENNEDQYEERIASEGWGDFTSWGTGKSPSTQDGNWSKETIKDRISDERVKIQEQLFDVEKHLGQNKNPDSGTNIIKTAKDKIEVVGLTFNDFESFRKDPAGKLVPYGVKVDPFGNSVYTQYRESGLVEHVAVDSMPGGKYHITANDEFKLIAGSNGIDIKTTGTLEQYASIITATTEDYNLNSSGDISLKAERIDLNADIITLRPNKVERNIEDESGGVRSLDANSKNATEPEQQVLVDGNLNVGLNTIIGGGLHVEGEVTLHHITAPLEYQITNECFEWGKQDTNKLDPANDASCEEEPEKSPVYADILPGCIIGTNKNQVTLNGIDSMGKAISVVAPPRSIIIESVLAENSVMVHPHIHTFANLPLKLIRDSTEILVTVGDKTDSKTVDPHSAIRAIGSRNNFAGLNLAYPVSNSSSPSTVTDKFGGSPCEPLMIQSSMSNESLPSGMGVRTEENQLDQLIKKAEDWNTKLEKQYIELQKKLDAIASV